MKLAVSNTHSQTHKNQQHSLKAEPSLLSGSCASLCFLPVSSNLCSIILANNFEKPKMSQKALFAQCGMQGNKGWMSRNLQELKSPAASVSHLANVNRRIETATTVKVQIAAQDGFFTSQQVNFHFRKGSPKRSISQGNRALRTCNTQVIIIIITTMIVVDMSLKCCCCCC